MLATHDTRSPPRDAGSGSVAGEPTKASAEAMFVVRMACREMRSSWRRLLFFFLCLSIGVAPSSRSARSHRGSAPRCAPRRARCSARTSRCRRTGGWTPGLWRPSRRGSHGSVRGSTRQVETLTMVRPADEAKRRRGWWNCSASIVSIRSMGRSSWKAAGPIHTGSSRGGARWCAGAARAARRRRRRRRGPRRHALSRSAASVLAEPAAAPARSASGRASSSTAAVSRPQACWASEPCDLPAPLQDARRRHPRPWHARCGRRSATNSFGTDVRSTEDQLGRELVRAENYLSLVGLIIVISRRRRRWSVHPRLRAAEAPQHRHPQVRGRQHTSDPVRLRCAGHPDGLDGQRHRAAPVSRCGGLAAPRGRRGHRARDGRPG